jgi:hypothetical protein
MAAIRVQLGLFVLFALFALGNVTFLERMIADHWLPKLVHPLNEQILVGGLWLAGLLAGGGLWLGQRRGKMPVEYAGSLLLGLGLAMWMSSQVMLTLARGR